MGEQDMRSFKYFISVIVLSCTGVAAQVSPTMPAPNRNITGPSQHRPPGGDHPESTAGTIEGFVYWDVNNVRHMSANSCSGLAITVSVGSSSGGPFTAYTPLGTLSNTFKYVGEVKEFLLGGKVNVYDVCTYAYDKLPVGPDLQVTLTVAQSGEFLPGAIPQFSTLGPIKIMNAQCNMLPRIVNPTASDLATHWGSCQNMAYDVNFVMLKTPRQQLGLASPPPGSSGSQGGMLSSTPQQGMLLSGATPAGTQTPSNPGSQRMGIMPTDRPGSGGTVELNPQPFPSRQQLTNADVIRMVRAGTLESVIVHSIQSSNKQFDFSRAGVQTLQQAHVSPAVLAAMCDGSAHSCPRGLGNNEPATPVGTSMKGQVNPGGQVSLNPQPLPPGQRLTNADVIKMLRSGVPESVIISSIQSATRNFDFSPSGCRALQQANVTATILKAMGEGSVRPCSEITRNAPPATPGGEAELNPQPLPPGSKAASRAVLKTIKLAPPKALRKITNTRLAQENASIIAVLERQRQAAQQESDAMKLATRSVASTVPARAPAAITFQGSAGVQNLGPETTQSEHGNLASSIVHAPAFNSIVLTCSNDPTPRIIQLSGGEGHGIFTPEAKYNLYTITGCSFGQSQSGNSAYIYGMNGFKASLNVDFWSDNGITAHLDPWLAGVLDQDNVTLVVAPAGKQPFNKSGYKFYAARGMSMPDGSDQEVQLAYDSMPQSKIALSNVSKFLVGVDQLPANAASRFPSFSFQGTPVMGWVFRYAYGHKDLVLPAADCFINDIPYNDDNFCLETVEGLDAWKPEPDTWNLSKLAPGFAMSSYELFYEDTDAKQLCSAWDGEYQNGHVLGSAWDSNFTPNQIVVSWLGYLCTEAENAGVNYRDEITAQSSYGLAVWVLGPRCVDPWTGQKDQTCINKVQAMFS
jgi:hypothetical protein